MHIGNGRSGGFSWNEYKLIPKKFKSSFGQIMLIVILSILGLIYLVNVAGLTPSGIKDGFTALREGGIPTYNEETMREFEEDLQKSVFLDAQMCQKSILITTTLDEDCTKFQYIIRFRDCDGNMVYFKQDAVDIDTLYAMPGGFYGDPNESPEIRFIREVGDRILSDDIDSHFYNSSTNPPMCHWCDVPHTYSTSYLLLCDEPHAHLDSYLRNDSNLELSEQAIAGLLAEYAEFIEIPVVIVVEDMADVFEKEMPTSAYGIIAIAVVAVLGVIFLILKKRLVRNRKKEDHIQSEGPELFK